MTRRLTGCISAAIALWALLSGCTREELDLAMNGRDIVFGASTMWQSDLTLGMDTRTEYSGYQESGTERINWMAGEDQIKIYCFQDSRNNNADYLIGTPTPSGTTSSAGIAPASGNGLQWGTGAHYFFALYPGPNTKWHYDTSKKGSDTGISLTKKATNQAEISGSIPATQNVVWNATDKEYEANMNYAYMYAGAYASSAGNTVTLKFHPLVTTLEFNLKAGSGLTNYYLTGFKLKSSSSSKTLAGPFKATVTQSANSNQPTCSIDSGTAGTSNEITLNIDNKGNKPVLTTNSTIKVTVLTRPVSQTNLSIEMEFTHSTNNTKITRTLDLKSRPNASSAFSFITVSPFCKAYVNDLTVPSDVWEYYITVTNPSALAAGGGTSNSGKVTSYRQTRGGGKKEAVKWQIQGYYSNAACTQSASSWFTSITSSGNGSVPSSSETITISYPATTSTATWDSTLDKTTSIGSTSNYKNLSNPNNMDSDYITESANCYIVNQPGYYRIPLVMGNGVINNAVNTNAATYRGDYNNTSGNMIEFPNYIGNSNGSPWLKDAGPASGYNMTLSSAYVVWQDVNGLVSNLSISGDKKWLYFRVPGTSQGNAVISIVDSWNLVCWQYHIWVTDYIPYNYPGYSSSKLQDSAVTGKSNQTFTMMPLNLGWVIGSGGSMTVISHPQRKLYVKLVQTGGGTASTVMEVTQNAGTPTAKGKVSGGWCPTYQWGRMTPMWPKSSGLYGTYPNINSSETKCQSFVYSFRYGDPYPNTVVGSQYTNALTFYGGVSSESNGSWCAELYPYNLWNAGNSTTGIHTTAAKKTVYDPCPAGYCVPVAGAFYNFTSNGTQSGTKNVYGSFDNGWYMYTKPYGSTQTEALFFPSHGLLWITGSYTNASEGSFYWTADPGRNSTTPYEVAYNLRISSSLIGPEWNHYRTTGGDIRPVRDTNR